jgi:hypothetical protein
MDAPNRQRYRTHFVMNTPRDGRELIMWIVKLPERCSLDWPNLTSRVTPLETQKSVDRISRVLSRSGVERFLRNSH